MIWHFGNTSVRSAMRLRDGLIALKLSRIEGNIRGKKGDDNFRNALGDYRIVSLGTDVTASVGRKWRSAMEKLGFIYPKLTGSNAQYQSDVGLADHISENGHRLIDAGDENFKAQQECFLRALIAYYINDGNGHFCSPLMFVLRLLLELDRRFGESKLAMIEMSLIVQCTSPSTTIDTVVEQIVDFRSRRDASKSKRKFDNAAYRKGC